MKRYVCSEQVVEAQLWDGQRSPGMEDLLGDHPWGCDTERRMVIPLPDNEELVVPIGKYVLRLITGEFIMMSRDLFKAVCKPCES